MGCSVVSPQQPAKIDKWQGTTSESLGVFVVSRVDDMSNSPSGLILAEPGASYRSGASENQWVEVLVDCPGVQQDQQQEQKLYTYRLPSELDVQPGIF